jgi:hypothetical protein
MLHKEDLEAGHVYVDDSGDLLEVVKLKMDPYNLWIVYPKTKGGPQVLEIRNLKDRGFLPVAEAQDG